MQKRFSLEEFYRQYETEATDIVVNGHQFTILLPKDLSQFINPDDVMHEFPLWAKIWPASWVLQIIWLKCRLRQGKFYWRSGAALVWSASSPPLSDIASP